ncbi:hypothetical protein PIB30_097640 [Stylosanthes scabra]|uniref:Uncharacterized protein n=1 Tax=Stylosanthes scabra TaxID=79078 RepID=A0ABU6SYT3_9FABA|nr:hypothetical protein [Stylosanthes scabra]
MTLKEPDDVGHKLWAVSRHSYVQMAQYAEQECPNTEHRVVADKMTVQSPLVVADKTNVQSYRQPTMCNYPEQNRHPGWAHVAAHKSHPCVSATSVTGGDSGQPTYRGRAATVQPAQGTGSQLRSSQDQSQQRHHPQVRPAYDLSPGQDRHLHRPPLSRPTSSTPTRCSSAAPRITGRLCCTISDTAWKAEQHHQPSAKPIDSERDHATYRTTPAETSDTTHPCPTGHHAYASHQYSAVSMGCAAWLPAVSPRDPPDATQR